MVVNTHSKLITTVYRSERHEGMYLFVERESGISDVPEILLEKFGAPVELMALVLTPGKKLAKADSIEVMQSISEQGFYLQISKEHDAEMLALAIKNTKL